LLLAAALLPWLQAPLAGGSSPTPVRVALVVLAVAALGPRPRAGPRRLAVVGVLSLGIAVAALLHRGLADPGLWDRIDEQDDRIEMSAFSDRFLAANRGAGPADRLRLDGSDPLARLDAALALAGAGWWLALLAGLGGIVAAGPRGRRSAAIAALVLAFALALGLTRPLLALWNESAGERALAHGRAAEAVERFALARRASAQARRSPALAASDGTARLALGFASDPVARLRVAGLRLGRGDLAGALAELDLARATCDPDLCVLVDRARARAHLRAGLDRYQGNEIAGAASEWERALEVRPDSVAAAYLGGRADYDLGRYAESLARTRQVLLRVHDPALRADALSNLGDAHLKRQELGLARAAYRQALRFDPNQNYRVLRALGGT
jgi:tetratricopeptide (TPR) repeat protein